MGKSLFSLKDILGRLSKFLQSMTSPLSGFNINDTKVKETSEGFSELFILNKELTGTKGANNEPVTNNQGQAIPLNILLDAYTVKSTFSPILSVLNNSGGILDRAAEDESAYKEVSTVFDILNGPKGLLTLNPSEDSGFYVNNPIKYKGTDWSWGDLALYKFAYNMECESPGLDYGTIEGQNIENCGKLISEYLMKVKIIDNVSEVQVDPETLIKPLLLKIQEWLAKYVENARAKNPNLAEAMDARKISTTEDDIKEFNPLATKSSEATNENTTDTNGGGDEVSNPNSSKHITVKLQRITGTSEIELLGLDSTCPPADTLNYIDDIINQDEFLDALTEEPQTFDIDVDTDGYDIEQCEDCEIDPCKSLEEVFKSGIRAYRNLYTLHWMANGNDMMKLHNLTEDMYKELIDEIDVVGELLVEKCGTVPALDFPCDYIPVQQYDFQTGLDYIKSLIQMYIDCIDCAYPNQASDVQSTLDEWLRYWNKQLNYFVRGQEI